MTHTRKAIATRKRIIDCAAVLITNEGFSRMRLEEVLQASQVQKGNFYYYFRSKDELGLAVLVENLDPAARHWLQGLLHEDGEPWADLQQLPDRLSTALAREDGALTVANQLAQDLCRAGGDFHSRAGEVLRALAGVLVERFERLQTTGRLTAAANPVQLGEFLASAIDGALFWQCLTGDSSLIGPTLSLALAGVTQFIRPA